MDRCLGLVGGIKRLSVFFFFTTRSAMKDVSFSDIIGFSYKDIVSLFCFSLGRLDMSILRSITVGTLLMGRYHSSCLLKVVSFKT